MERAEFEQCDQTINLVASDVVVSKSRTGFVTSTHRSVADSRNSPLMRFFTVGCRETIRDVMHWGQKYCADKATLEACMLHKKQWF